MANKQACGDPWSFEMARQQADKGSIDRTKALLMQREAEILQLYQDLSKLRAELAGIAIEKSDEYMLRNKHPGLEKLWDQYQTMLMLVKENDDE